MRVKRELARKGYRLCALIQLIKAHQGGEELIFLYSTQLIGGTITRRKLAPGLINRINYYQERDVVHPRLDVSVAFQQALSTWGAWVDKYINPRKTLVFFRSPAPSHFSGGQWNTGGHCREATKPIGIIPPATSYPEKNRIVEAAIKQMRTPVIYLNITAISRYRIDGHPSIYGSASRTRSGIQDCSHWCLPGLPDTWNQILYSHLLLKAKERSVE